MRIYFAVAMSGRTGNELIAQAKKTAQLCKLYKVKALDPIVSEHIKPSDDVLANGGKLLQRYWQRDKQMIENSHVLIDRTAWMKSEGSAHECGFNRYHLHHPTIRVFPGLKESIAQLEDDLITETEAEAVALAVEHWGSWQKRLRWKWRIFKKSYWNLLKVRLNWFLDWRD